MITRRGFISTLAAAGVAAALPLQSAAQRIPTEFYDLTAETWQPLGGLEFAKKGQIYRGLDSRTGKHMPMVFTERAWDERTWYGVAEDDGRPALNEKGQSCGEVATTFFADFEDAKAHAESINA